MKDSGIKIICQNKKLYHDYDVIESLEAGILLQGTEIKSLRDSNGSFNDAYCSIHNNEIFLKGFHIAHYKLGNIFNHDPDRDKKLLLHKKEIIKLAYKKTSDGFTIVPSKVYFKGSLVKVEICLVKGKKLYDKRETLKKEDQSRYIKKF